MIAAQGGIFGWVAPSAAYVSAISALATRLRSVEGTGHVHPHARQL
jgi:hypothetical protein